MGKISSNPSLICTQNEGAELKATLGKGFWGSGASLWLAACRVPRSEQKPAEAAGSVGKAKRLNWDSTHLNYTQALKGLLT